jgi:hypothetical protein
MSEDENDKPTTIMSQEELDKSMKVDANRQAWLDLAAVRQQETKRNNKLDQIATMLRGEMAKLRSNISMCCGEKCGQQFCEGFGCSTLRHFDRSLSTILTAVLDTKDIEAK